MKFTNGTPQGWYLDPYGAHEARWFSAGSATALVRDGSSESTDAPPDFPFVGRLVPAPQPEGELLHASGGQEDQSVRAAWEIFVSTGGD